MFTIYASWGKLVWPFGSDIPLDDDTTVNIINEIHKFNYRIFEKVTKGSFYIWQYKFTWDDDSLLCELHLNRGPEKVILPIAFPGKFYTKSQVADKIMTYLFKTFVNIDSSVDPELIKFFPECRNTL